MEENVNDSIFDREILRLGNHIAKKKECIYLDKLPDVRRVFDEYCVALQEKSKSLMIAQWNEIKNSSVEHGKKLVSSMIGDSISVLNFICSLLPSKYHDDRTRDRLEMIWGDYQHAYCER